MKQEQLEKIRKRLEQEKKELEKLEERLETPPKIGEPGQVGALELSAYDNHPGDYGSELYERSKDLGLRQIIRSQRTQVEEALRALEEGDYGYCRRCGRPIAFQRLEASPGTFFCTDCQSLLEAGEVGERPVEEKFLFPPFGRTFTDETDSVIFDGEDAWEAVARYGTSSYTETDDEAGEEESAP